MVISRIEGLGTLICAASLLSVSLQAANMDSLSLTARDRIVNLGDSHTDGHTYALLTQAALVEAGKPTPNFIGAGIGGDIASGMLTRLDRDVLTLSGVKAVIWLEGINDFSKNGNAEADAKG